MLLIPSDSLLFSLTCRPSQTGGVEPVCCDNFELKREDPVQCQGKQCLEINRNN